ncbi:MAG: 16S rRNA (uracil(1498)-N(3))-methyltransferase [Proteobacteria bacterium]|nr:16S rRNA (uracil(1498)-N(3))-methyltransferase [Pseudomonadota bacterium]
MNILLFTDSDIVAPGQIKIRGRRFEHLVRVLGIEVGRQLRVGELGGELGLGTVLKVTDAEALISVELNQTPPPKLPLSLVLALPRPKMLRRILRTVAELGVSELHLINSYRVEKSYWSTPALNEEKIRAYFIDGLEQSRDTVLPDLYLHHRFKPFVEDQLPALIGNKRGLAAHPGDYPACPHDIGEDTLMVIGPEGGFIPFEVEKLQQAGCEIVSLGSRILRVENAVTNVIGRLF